MPSNKSTKTKTKRKRKSKKTTKAAAVTAAPATASVEQTAPVVNETTSATSVADDAVTAEEVIAFLNQ